MDKDTILKEVNIILASYPWGGHVEDLHQNEYGEWIADCVIPGHDYINKCVNYERREQKMIWIKDGKVWPELFDAKDNKRLPTFMEEGDGEYGDGGLYNEWAPDSSYIKTSRVNI